MSAECVTCDRFSSVCGENKEEEEESNRRASMEGSSDPSKGRTFSMDLSSDGAVRLRETVKQKLSEFMGSYTDDVLAEYVVVLVCHGKHQDQAKKDLDAFLGDHSSAFVAWLWDHIASNMHMYAASSQPTQAVQVNDQAKTSTEERVKRGSERQSKKSIDAESLSKAENGTVSILTHAEVIERPNKGTESRRRREWIPSDHKSVREANETPKLQTNFDERDEIAASEKIQFKGKSSLKRRRSPEPWLCRERNYQDERHVNKQRISSPPAIDAPRRLLQSAVREAVGPIGTMNSKRAETASKRLRSVVSTATENPDASFNTVEAPHRPRALAKSLPAMAIAMKAAAAAAEDVTRVRSTGSVFDRLGKRLDTDFNGLEEVVDEHMMDDEQNVENTMTETDYQGHEYRQRPGIRTKSGSRLSGRLSRGLVEEVAMMENESVMPLDPTTDSEGYDEVQDGVRYTHGYASAARVNRQLDDREADEVSRLSTFKERQRLPAKQPDKHPEESVTVQYRLARKPDKMARESRMQNVASPARPSASRKIVNISVNVNTWKPPHFQSARDTVDGEPKTSTSGLKLLPDQSDMDVDASLPADTGMGLQPDGGQIVPPSDANDQAGADFYSDVRKGISSTSAYLTAGAHASVRQADDGDSRTVFVTNVHFAATREALSKHFNRCGEVVKVVILTDAATGQPKGAAYVEFAHGETADIALTLNETSFMSRMLKVVRKSSSNLETSMLARPPLRRPLPFVGRHPTRASYARGFPVAYRRGYMPRAFGNRNLQWKRDASTGVISENSASSVKEPSATVSCAPTFGTSSAGSASARLTRSFTYIRNPTKASNENSVPVQE